MKEFEKIDAHSHFGKSYLGPESLIDDYLLQAKKLGVMASIVSPGPSPEVTKNPKLVRPCLWRFDDGKVTYLKQIADTSSKETFESETNSNPYHNVNISLINKARKLNRKGIIPRILVMPIHHPILDTNEEIVAMLSSPMTVALKVHGIATFSGPMDISAETIKVLLKQNKPVVVHSDTFRGKITKDIHFAYKLNDPVLWVEWARETGIKTLITHGARLSPEAIRLARSMQNVVIGISPDLLISSEPERLHHDPKDFLLELTSTIPSDKLVFDIDYAWNVRERNQWNNMDWQMCVRLEAAAKIAGLTSEDLEKIYYRNAVRFYNI